MIGCVAGHKTYKLGDAQETAFKALAGATVAIERSEGQPEPLETLLVVIDLHTGRAIRKVHTHGRSCRSGAFCYPDARQVVLKEDGSLAWVTESGRFSVESTLHAVDKNGSRILAVGETLPPGAVPNPIGNLMIQGDSLYWTQEGKVLSAPLD